MKRGKRYRMLGAGLLAGGLALAAPAWADGTCSSGMATEGIATDNMTFEGAIANDCYGMVAGNINKKDGAAFLNGLSWGSGWTYLDATNGTSTSFMGLQFTVSSTLGATGSWTLTGVDTNGGAPLNLPASLDFAIGLKAGSEYALWGFDNVVVDGSDNGTFSIVFANKGSGPNTARTPPPQVRPVRTEPGVGLQQVAFLDDPVEGIELIAMNDVADRLPGAGTLEALIVALVFTDLGGFGGEYRQPGFRS